MTREEMRMAFWSDVFTTKLSDHLEQDALKIADQALAEFDKRFPAQKEIKETGRLGITLDTERPWIRVGDKLPEVNKDVEVMFEDITTDIGWRGTLGYWYSRGHESDNSEHGERSKKTVITWRELSTTNEA